MNTLYICPSGISLKENLKKFQNISKLDENVKVYLTKIDNNDLMKFSAEVNSLYRMGLKEDDRVIFLASDTDEGEKIATILAEILKKRNRCEVKVKRIKGLQTIDKDKFDKEGIPNLTDVIIDEVERNRYSYNIILNATGGFKAVIPYITFIGMIFNLPIRYIFERSESIIELPSIPIEFDLKKLKQLEPVIDKILSDYISVDEFRRSTDLSYNEFKTATQDILLEENGFVTLRPTGRILYKRYLQVKGRRVFYSSVVKRKISSGSYNREVFMGYFRKMRDPIHLQSKLHNEVKKEGRIDLECYKPGATNERIFFYTEGKNLYICDIFMHDEYERLLKEGGLLKKRFINKSQFKELPE
jgi:putative CRISPR-associated protein (TIGR02619 family)